MLYQAYRQVGTGRGPVPTPNSDGTQVSQVLLTSQFFCSPGQLRESLCPECAVKLANFEDLKHHFSKMHFERWMPRQSLTVLRKVPAKRELLTGIGCLNLELFWRLKMRVSVEAFVNRVTVGLQV